MISLSQLLLYGDQDLSNELNRNILELEDKNDDKKKFIHFQLSILFDKSML